MTGTRLFVVAAIAACSDPFVDAVYRNPQIIQRKAQGKAYCLHCGLESRLRPGGIVLHNEGCALALLFQRAGGPVEFRQRIEPKPETVGLSEQRALGRVADKPEGVDLV